jgi:competence protein ComEA
MHKKIIAGLLLFGATSLMAMNVSDLNKASKEDLMAIKGIGEAKAEAIIKARDMEKFKSVDELTRVKGIGQAIVENVKNDVMSAS